MKKIVKFIGVLVLAFLSFALISCGHDKDFGQGDVVKKGIKINGKVLSNTSEVCVTPKKVTITGTTPDFIDALIWRPYWFMTLLSRYSSIPSSAGSIATCASLDSRVPAMAGFLISNRHSSFFSDLNDHTSLSSS